MTSLSRRVARYAAGEAINRSQYFPGFVYRIQSARCFASWRWDQLIHALSVPSRQLFLTILKSARVRGCATIRARYRMLAIAGALVCVKTTPAQVQDTIRIKSTSAPLWGSSVKLSVLKDFGRADGPEEYSFGSLGAFTFDKKGRLYAYDAQDKKLRAYDESGKYLRDIGAFGAGPSEFKSVSSLLIEDDSVVVVRDGSNGRVSSFFPNGKLRGSFSNPTLTRISWRHFRIDHDGFATYKTRRDADVPKGAEGVERERYSQFIRLNAKGVPADSFKVPVSILDDDSKMFTIASWGGGNNFQARSYAAALRSGGFVAGDGNSMRLVLRPTQGAVRVVERSWKAVPLGREERDNWTEIADNIMKRPYVGVGGTGKPRDYQIPAVKPVFNDLFTDEDSRIWVAVYALAHKVELPPPPANSANNPRLTWRQPEVYEIFSDKGDYLGRVELPDKIAFLSARGNRMWARAKGPDDEDIIRVYTMTGSAALNKQ